MHYSKILFKNKKQAFNIIISFSKINFIYEGLLMDNWDNSSFVKHWDSTHLEGNPVRKEQLKVVKHLVKKYYEPESEILDIGIGTGILEEMLYEENSEYKIYGVDGSQIMVQLAKKRLSHIIDNVSFVIGDLEKIQEIKFPKKNGKVAVSIQTLHNLSNHAKITIFERVYEWLLPGGIFIIMDRIKPYPPKAYNIYKTMWKYLEHEFNTVIKEEESYDDHKKKLNEKGDNPLSLLEHISLLEKAGFNATVVHLVANRTVFVGLKDN